jgi:hypothetical protein
MGAYRARLSVVVREPKFCTGPTAKSGHNTLRNTTVTTAASMSLERKMDMHTLTFNDNERTLLIEILEAYLAGLPHEIHQTNNRVYRDMLEEKQSTLQQLLKRLQES